MTTVGALYDNYLTSIGNPQHLVMQGPDWWGCVCNVAGDSQPLAAEHAELTGAGEVTTGWTWREAWDPTEPMAGWHRRLWEAGAFQ